MPRLLPTRRGCALYPERADCIVYTEKGRVRCRCPSTGEERGLAFWGFDSGRNALKSNRAARVVARRKGQPSPYCSRVGLPITRFEACSTFTHVAAAWSPSRLRDPSHRSASVHVVVSIDRSDCYRLERQLPGGIRTR